MLQENGSSVETTDIFEINEGDYAELYYTSNEDITSPTLTISALTIELQNQPTVIQTPSTGSSSFSGGIIAAIVICVLAFVCFGVFLCTVLCLCFLFPKDRPKLEPLSETSMDINAPEQQTLNRTVREMYSRCQNEFLIRE
jgi:hypothetical protein